MFKAWPQTIVSDAEHKLVRNLHDHERTFIERRAVFVGLEARPRNS